MSTIRQQIVDVCRKLNEKGMLASGDGNVSFRLPDDRILITPTGVNKAFIVPGDLALVNFDNQVLEGAPSGERLMHLEVYRRCPTARAVVHAHPPHAVAWSVAHPGLTELPAECLSELILAAGRIPIVPYARPGTQDMGDQLAPFLPDCKIMVLARHGGLSWGEDLIEAYNGMERLEHSAEVLGLAMMMGGLSRLPDDEVAILRAMRAKIGGKTL